MEKQKKSKKKKWVRMHIKPNMLKLNEDTADAQTEVQEDEQIIVLKERKKQTLLRIDQLKSQLSDFPRYPYLQLPWQNQEAIVDLNEYTKAFHLPERIVPQIHKIDPRTTSIEQLALEKKIMENKIADLFVKKKTEINLNDDEDTTGNEKEKNNKPDSTDEEDNDSEDIKTTVNNKSIILTSTSNTIKIKKPKKDKDIMKVFQTERMRLFNENLEKQIEKENYYTILTRNLNEKRNELDNLKKELSNFRKEFKTNEKHLTSNIKELEENIRRLLISIADAKNEFVDKLNQKFILERKNLKAKFDHLKLQKQKDFLKAKTEIERKLESKHRNLDELRHEINELEALYERDLNLFEMGIMDEECKLYDRINDEEDRFIEFSQREEDNTLKPLRDSKQKQINELAELNEQFKQIKSKLDEKISKLEEEVNKFEKEKEIIERENEENVRIQTLKLRELLDIERKAREKLRCDLDNYRKSIMKIREKNLELRYDLSLLLHCHGINRPYVFSYFSEWPFYAMDKFIEGQSPNAKN